jgi:hypothetical protein
MPVCACSVNLWCDYGAGVGPFLHRGREIIMGKREINNFNLIR